MQQNLRGSQQRPSARPQQGYSQKNTQPQGYQKQSTQQNQRPAPPMPEVRRVIVVKVLAEGNLRAYFDVDMAGLLLHGLKLVQQPGQRAWAACPQSEWFDGSQTKRYRTVAEWPREWGGRITELLEDALHEFEATGETCYEPPPPAPPTFGSEVRRQAGIGGGR